MDTVGDLLLPEALVLDLPELDVQHGEIFSRIEAIKGACLETSTLPMTEVDELLAFLGGHFATEERMAEEAGVYFSDHADQHRKSLESISRAVHAVSRGTLDVFCLLRYLECWFERHITDADKPFAERLVSLQAQRHFRPRMQAAEQLAA